MEGALPKAQVVDNIRQVASNILPHGSIYIFMARVPEVMPVRIATGTCCCCSTNPLARQTISKNTYTPSCSAASICGSISVSMHILKMTGITARMPCFSIMLKKISNWYMSLKEEDRRILLLHWYRLMCGSYPVVYRESKAVYCRESITNEAYCFI